MNELQILQIEIERAKRELQEAEEKFKLAKEDFIEPAIYELLAKQKKLSALLKRAKECA